MHYVRDITQGEDASRIRTGGLPQIWSVARNLALNLYRERGYKNMARAQHFAGATLNTLKTLFRMKWPCRIISLSRSISRYYISVFFLLNDKFSYRGAKDEN